MLGPVGPKLRERVLQKELVYSKQRLAIYAKIFAMGYDDSFINWLGLILI
jgi:hypothetical protein